MRLTNRGRYAVTAMLDLGMHSADGPVCIGAIAQRQGISAAYLERLFRNLREQDLVCSTRGHAVVMNSVVAPEKSVWRM